MHVAAERKDWSQCIKMRCLKALKHVILLWLLQMKSLKGKTLKTE